MGILCISNEEIKVKFYCFWEKWQFLAVWRFGVVKSLAVVILRFSDGFMTLNRWGSLFFPKIMNSRRTVIFRKNHNF